MKKKIISLIVCLLLLTACGTKYETITADTVRELVADNAVIIDVRETSEYEEGHIEGSVNIPVSKIGNVDYDKDTKIIVYCVSGTRSANAANELIKLGYTNVYNLDGGIINWDEELVVDDVVDGGLEADDLEIED